MKYLKLSLIAALLIGAVCLLVFFTTGGGAEHQAGVSSSIAKKLEAEIVELCEDGKWSPQGYKDLANKINTYAKDKNIQPSEKNSLALYLYTASCKSVFNSADTMFKQESYPEGKVLSLETALEFLDGLQEGSNSNLTQGKDILREYKTLLGYSNLSSQAIYSNPLKAFGVSSAGAIRQSLEKMRYYKSHFSKNNSIKSRIENVISNLPRIESAYYENLEKCVEENYYKIREDMPRWQAIEQVQKDYNRFKEISSNSSATSKLYGFINGNHK